MKPLNNSIKLSITLLILSLMLGCAMTPPPLATATQLATLNVEAIQDNSGEYMSPITSDNIPAEWVDNSINAKIGASVGGAIGAYAGAKLVGSIPFIGGFLGAQVGDHIGRETAILAAGGEEFIKDSSDLSFNDLEDMAVYLYVNYGENPNYQALLDATYQIYPDLKQINYTALSKATTRYKDSLPN